MEVNGEIYLSKKEITPDLQIFLNKLEFLLSAQLLRGQVLLLLLEHLELEFLGLLRGELHCGVLLS